MARWTGCSGIVARTAQQALQAAGAMVYAEVEDLSHTYPEEYSAKVLIGSRPGGRL